VTIIEILEKMASDILPMVRRRRIDGLKHKQVVMLTNATCEKIGEASVTVTIGGYQKRTIQADSVILATGYKKDDSLFKALEFTVPEIYCIGDSSQPRGIMDATNDGYRVGLSFVKVSLGLGLHHEYERIA